MANEQQPTTIRRTLREIALGSVAPALREPLLAWASENGINTPDDAFWPLATAMANGMAAAAQAGQHVQALTAETAKIPDAIYNSTLKASADLKAGVAQAIEAKTLEAGSALVQVIGVAASKGAVDLQKAAAALDKVGAEKTAAIVETWTRSLAKAATTHERARLFRASGWLVLGALILFCGGGFGMLETLAASGKIAPPGINTAWNPAALYGPNAWEVCPPGTDQTCVRPRGPASKNPSKIRWFLSKYL